MGKPELPVAVLDVCRSKLDAYNWGLVVYIYMEYGGNNHMNYLNYIHLYMGYPQWSHGLCILAYEPLSNWHAAQEGALLDQGNQNIKSYSQRPKTHGDFALQLAMMDAAGFLAFRGQLTHPYKDWCGSPNLPFLPVDHASCTFQCQERLVIVTALMIMNLMGASVAPMVGNVLTELFGTWRGSFFVVAVIWAVLTLYAWMDMKESCPDVEGRTQENFLRILEPHSICLLLGQGCFVAAYMTFIGNISYLAETTFGLSPRASSAIMLVYPACTVLGLVLMNWSHFSSVQIARVTVVLFTFIGLVSFVLASYFSDFLWSYLVGSFSQATVQTVGVVSLNVLFFAPLEDCAGIAAAYDMILGGTYSRAPFGWLATVYRYVYECVAIHPYIHTSTRTGTFKPLFGIPLFAPFFFEAPAGVRIARSIIPSVFSLISTQALIHFGAKGLSQFQASTCLAAGAVFSYYAISPPSQDRAVGMW